MASERDLDEELLPEGLADGAWSRWSYAFLTQPRALLQKVADALRPGDFVWQWPKAFVATGLQRLVDHRRVDDARARIMQDSFERARHTPCAFLLTPTVLEIIARKR